MKRFWKTTLALFKKDWKDSMRNGAMAMLLLIPVLMGVIFKFVSVVDLGGEFILQMTVSMTLAMVPLSYLSSIIAEEKEKHTLRTLMLSGVSAGEFITSKVLVVWVLTEIVNIINYIVAGMPFGGLPMFLLITSLGSVCMLMLGAVIGVASRDQASSSVLSVPVMILLFFPTAMKMISPVFEAVAAFTPIERTLHLFTIWSSGGSIFSKDGLVSILIIVIWTAVSVLLYVWAYKKKRLDA